MNDHQESLFRVVLVEPEIPQNTGNIGRTCVGTNCELHLIQPMSFEITDSNLKRAGLDYWQHLRWYTHKNYQDWFSKVEDPSRVFYFTTKVLKTYYEIQFQKGDWLVFGKETTGLTAEQIERVTKIPGRVLKLPMPGEIRSLNLSNAVAVSFFELFRQIGRSRFLDR